MIPTQTTPLAKAIRTLEGQLITVSNVAVVATAAIDPSALPPKYAAFVVAGQNIVLAISRALVKVKASKVVNEVIDSANVGDVVHVVEHVVEPTDPAVIATVPRVVATPVVAVSQLEAAAAANIVDYAPASAGAPDAVTP